LRKPRIQPMLNSMKEIVWQRPTHFAVARR
jgi:hypothetical protein